MRYASRERTINERGWKSRWLNKLQARSGSSPIRAISIPWGKTRLEMWLPDIDAINKRARGAHGTRSEKGGRVWKTGPTHQRTLTHSRTVDASKPRPSKRPRRSQESSALGGQKPLRNAKHTERGVVNKKDAVKGETGRGSKGWGGTQEKKKFRKP